MSFSTFSIRTVLLAFLAVAAGLTLGFAQRGTTTSATQQTQGRAGTAPAAKSPADADPVVITVGTEQVHARQFAAQFEALVQSATPESQQQMMADRKKVAGDIAQMMALAAEAHRTGIDADPAVAAQVALARNNALASAEVRRLQVAANPTDAQIQAYYAAHTANYTQVQLKHILIADDETPGSPQPRSQTAALARAQAAVQRLKNGEAFTAVAKTDSDDPNTKDKGGEVGNLMTADAPAGLQDVLNTIPVGQVSDPVHTQYGYEVIVVEARGGLPIQQAKSLVADEIVHSAVQDQMNKITSAAKVTLNDAYFAANH